MEALFCLEDRPPLDLRVLELLTCFLSLLAGLAAGVALRLLAERTAGVRPFLGLGREAFDDLLEDALLPDRLRASRALLTLLLEAELFLDTRLTVLPDLLRTLSERDLGHCGFVQGNSPPQFQHFPSDLSRIELPRPLERVWLRPRESRAVRC